MYLTMNEDRNTATCHICNRVVKCKGGNTSNMRKHLKRHGINLQGAGQMDDMSANPMPSTSASSVGVTAPADPELIEVDVEDVDDDDDDTDDDDDSTDEDDEDSRFCSG